MVDPTVVYAFLLFKNKMKWIVGINLLLYLSLYVIFGFPNIHAPNRLLIIPRGCTRYQLKEKLKNEGYIRNGTTFLLATYLLKYHPKNSPGQYRLINNMNNWQVVRMLRGGKQHPVKLTFSNAANKTVLVNKLVSRTGITKEELWSLLHDTKKLSFYGFTTENVLTMFIPDTYEVYWTITAEQLLSKMYLAYKRFWNATRLSKAEKIHLNPISVSVLASIVQAETNDQQDAAMIAGVYLNRLKRNMPLQSCPMLIYALKEDHSSIRRVLQQDTYIHSPYNSYRTRGLPPGPILLPSTAMIDAVLNYTPHDYLFFSAKEDFSGLHYFSRNYTEHLKYAYKYKKTLNRLKIMR